MDESKTRVLIVDDDAPMREMVLTSLSQEGFETISAAGPDQALEFLNRESVDVVVTDVRMGESMNGIELCARIVQLRSDIPVIVITAFGNMELAIAAIRAGAHDFVPKPFSMDELILRIRRAAEARTLRHEVHRLREDRAQPVPFSSILGRSPAMEEVFALVERVAHSEASVLVSGETGTGKELVARAIHTRSRRAGGPFVAINCAAVPETLLESELFGHVRGAFTDARSARLGLFVRASHGTLFLDEIGEMPPAIQAKLLRALQERVVRPVGSDQEVPFDARIVSATHRDLETAVADGTFREDLYYRLAVVDVKLPPLRSRGNDILLLAQDFLTRIAERDGRAIKGIDPECARQLMEYPWPGNVRELANVIERAIALASMDVLTTADLPERIRTYKSSHVVVSATSPEELVRLEEVERRYILRVLEATAGHRTRTAEILGLDRKTLYNKLKTYGIND